MNRRLEIPGTAKKRKPEIGEIEITLRPRRLMHIDDPNNDTVVNTVREIPMSMSTTN